MQHPSSNRRSFIKASSALAGSALLLPSFIACSKSGQQETSLNKTAKAASEPIVGQGDYTYRVHKNWGTQDLRKFPVMDCHEMIQDKAGRLFLLTNHPKNNILIYDRSGRVLDTWTLGWKGAHGLSIAQEGSQEVLYLTSYEEHKVLKTDLQGNILLELEYPKETGAYTAAKEYKPTETCIGPNGDIYVADGYGKNYIIQYTAKGEYIRHWGGKGKADDQFDCCHGVTLDTRDPANPSLLITSRSQQCFKRFNLDGQYQATISMPGCWICRPVIKGQLLYFAVIVTKTWGAYDGCLAILDANNKVVSFPGANAPVYTNGVLQKPAYDDVTFLNPHDVCIDQDENIYVPQWASGRTYPILLERV